MNSSESTLLPTLASLAWQPSRVDIFGQSLQKSLLWLFEGLNSKQQTV